MLIFILSLLFAHADYELPRQYIVASPIEDEFSERMLYAPFTKLTPQPLQLTSPYFETLFNTLSSVQSRSSGSPATSIRGSAQAGRVLYLLDDVPLNFLDGFGGSSLFVPTEILSQIHIFEGPSSASYGPNALGGSIHFVSQKRKTALIRVGLSDTDTSYLPSEGGTLSTANIAAIVPLISTDQYQLQGSAFFQKDRGDYPYIDPNGKKDRRRDNSENLSRFTLIGHSRWDRLELTHVLLYTGLNKRTPGSLYFPQVTEQNSDAFLAAFSTNYKTSNTSMWTSRLSYSLLHSDFYDTAPSKSNSDKLWISQGFSWQFWPHWLSQTTFDLNKNYYLSSYFSGQKYDRLEPEIAQTIVIPVTDNITIEPTARYLTKYKETLFQINAPYSFQSTKMWLMYSQGFRPPALIDLYAKEAFYVGNPNLTPEKSQQFEAGSSWTYRNMELSTSVYRIDYKNLFQGTVNGSGVFSKRNAGEARSYGLSTKLNLSFEKWLYYFSYSNLLARERPSDTPLLFSPEHQVFTSLTYQKNNWSLILQQTLWSGFQDLNFTTGFQTRLAAWQSTDLLYFTKVTKKISASAGVYNIFDKKRELTFGYPEPQRRVALSMEYSF
jgi:outer membrane cobalamin receptor